MIDFVHRYAEQGFKLVALRPRGKTPLSDKTSYKNATSDLTILEAWWGATPKANIGIQPGASGYAVLDVDPKNGGNESFKKIQDEFGIFATRSVTTPTGGQHFYFRLTGNIIPNAIGFLPGLDLICEKNHIVAPPSIHPKGGQYTWDIEDADIIDMPPWLLELVTKKEIERPVAPPTRRMKKLGQLSQATIRFLAEGAPVGERNNSVFKAAKDAQEQGYSKEWFIDQLAKNLPEYVTTENLLTIDSAFKSAPKYAPRVDNKDAWKKLALKCYLMVDNTRPTNYLLMDPNDGDTYRMHLDVVREVLNGEELNSFLTYNKKIVDFRYEPRELGYLLVDQKTQVDVYNTYIPPLWKREYFFRDTPVPVVKEIPKRYDEFLTYLTGGHEESKHYILDWIANSLHTRNFTILTAIGEEGIGKGILGKILEQLHGAANFVQVRDEVFKNRFNSQLANRTLVYADEIDLKTNEAHDRLKAVVNDTMEIEAKGEDARTVRNHASFYLSSNRMDAVKVSPSDRRFSIVALTNTKMMNTEFINRINEFTDDANCAEFGSYLFHRKITFDMKRPFRSGRFEEMMEYGLTDWERFVIFEWAPANVGKTIELEKLQAIVRDEPDANVKFAPGRRKFEELARKYPHLLRVRKLDEKASERVVDVIDPRKPVNPNDNTNLVRPNPFPTLSH